MTLPDHKNTDPGAVVERRGKKGQSVFEIAKQNYKKKIAICFFGITRSLKLTHASIIANVVNPINEIAESEVLCHFYDLNEIANIRTSEFAQQDARDAYLLKPDWIEFEEPNGCLVKWNFESIKKYGDITTDDFKTISNLIHQLHSLKKVSDEVLRRNYDICIFVRPDLVYHDNFRAVILAAIGVTRPTVFLPEWQSWGGYNDRFAICVGSKAISSYGSRIKHALTFCERTMSPLFPEKLLKFSLQHDGIDVVHIKNRATRLRITGVYHDEDFSSPLCHNKTTFVNIISNIISRLFVVTRSKLFMKKIINRWRNLCRRAAG